MLSIGPHVRRRLAPPPMDFCDCFLRETSTNRPDPRHGPSSATEGSFRREDVLATSRPAVHGICDRRGRFDRRMHNKLTRDDVHCAACRDRPKLRARSHELRRGGPIIMWTSAAPDIKSNREVLRKFMGSQRPKMAFLAVLGVLKIAHRAGR